MIFPVVGLNSLRMGLAAKMNPELNKRLETALSIAKTTRKRSALPLSSQ